VTNTPRKTTRRVGTLSVALMLAAVVWVLLTVIVATLGQLSADNRAALAASAVCLAIAIASGAIGLALGAAWIVRKLHQAHADRQVAYAVARSKTDTFAVTAGDPAADPAFWRREGVPQVAELLEQDLPPVYCLVPANASASSCPFCLAVGHWTPVGDYLPPSGHNYVGDWTTVEPPRVTPADGRLSCPTTGRRWIVRVDRQVAG
jgi:hypothetical protein